ncbi:MAG: CHAD domain-containing protein, partial [Gammaproteobacteria bacterium]
MPRPLHLVCAGSRTLETLEQQFAGGQPARWQREHLVRSLYDSADRRLQAAGLYLCHDVPDSHGDERGELWLGDREGRLRAPALAGVAPPPRAAAALPGAVLAPLLVPLLRPRVLLEVRRWSLERSRRAWRNEDAKILGDILLERHDYPGGALVTVTVLPLRGYRRELSRALAAGIARAGLNALAESATAVVDAHANGPWDRPSPPAAIAPDTPAAAAIAARLAYYRAVMQANERGIGEDVDSEFLHDFRVALRRARALVQAFATFLPDAAALREGFAWLSRETSLLRDLDVWLEGFDDAGATALPALYEHLAARRQREQRRLARV